MKKVIALLALTATMMTASAQPKRPGPACHERVRQIQVGGSRLTGQGWNH